MNIIIKEITRENLVSRQGKPWKSCNITTYSQSQNKDVRLSGFGGGVSDTWEIGDTVDVDVIDKQNGYFDWRANENTKASPDRKLELLKRIDTKLDILLGKQSAQSIAKEFNGEVMSDLGNPVNPKDINVKDIPF